MMFWFFVTWFIVSILAAILLGAFLKKVSSNYGKVR